MIKNREVLTSHGNVGGRNIVLDTGSTGTNVHDLRVIYIGGKAT